MSFKANDESTEVVLDQVSATFKQSSSKNEDEESKKVKQTVPLPIVHQ